jgi:glycosyltransferase involved in cell wall biosynthesis
MLPRLKATAPPGTTFFGHVTEAKKHDLMARAHVLVATSVREGWGLTVSEAALCGTRAIAYDVAGLRDSVRAAGGLLVEPQPGCLADALVRLLPAWTAHYKPMPANVGVTSWSAVARSIITRLAATPTRQPLRGSARSRLDLLLLHQPSPAARTTQLATQLTPMRRA